MAYELHFAPLQGYTDAVFRNAFAKHFGGVDVYYTPFIRIEKGDFRRRDLRDLEPEANRVPELVPQILPGTPDELRRLAEAVQAKGYRAADINLGCPFPPIVGKRKGAGMLPHPDLVEEVLRATEEFPEMLFSLKMRLGWEEGCECMNLVDAISSLRLRHVTVHARTGKQQYKGPTNPEAFAAFYERCRQPLFYNGDLLSPEDIHSIRERFPLLRGVSVGRGFLSSPFMGAECKGIAVPIGNERANVIFDFHNELLSVYSERLQGEAQLLSKMKSLWEHFLPETDRKLLKQIHKSNRLETYREAVRKIFQP